MTPAYDYKWDQSAELFMVRNRVYQAEIGAWVQRDPFEYIDGANLFEYVRSSPLSLSDPFGLQGYRSHHPTFEGGGGRNNYRDSRYGFLTLPPGEKIASFTRDQLEAAMEQKQKLSTGDKVILDFGCIGLCAIRQGQTHRGDSRVPFINPRGTGGTRCFLDQLEALLFNCPEGRVRNVFQVRGYGLGSDWGANAGDPLKIIDQTTGEVDPFSMHLGPTNLEERNAIINRETNPAFDFSTYLGDNIWEHANIGTGAGVTREDQTFYLTKGTPPSGPDAAYPYVMYCVRCKISECKME